MVDEHHLRFSDIPFEKVQNSMAAASMAMTMMCCVNGSISPVQKDALITILGTSFRNKLHPTKILLLLEKQYLMIRNMNRSDWHDIIMHEVPAMLPEGRVNVLHSAGSMAILETGLNPNERSFLLELAEWLVVGRESFAAFRSEFNALLSNKFGEHSQLL